MRLLIQDRTQTGSIFQLYGLLFKVIGYPNFLRDNSDLKSSIDWEFHVFSVSLFFDVIQTARLNDGLLTSSINSVL